ncbi:MAG: hypothetical protein ABIR24_03800 [Verrucomicrobiota bacterium]
MRTGLSPLTNWLWPALFLMLVACAAITNRTFWIDECVTAHVADHTNLIEAWEEMVDLRFAEVQMPFFIAYMWGFEKFFGDSEVALRLAGLPFFLIGMTLLLTALARRWRNLWALMLTIGLSPFVWYYLNEARLYTMQMGASAMVVAALFRLSENPAPTGKTERWWLRIYCSGLVLLSVISMLGEIWALAPLLAVLVVITKERLFGWWRPYRTEIIATLTILFFTGIYYLWSLTRGARATAVGTTNLQTFLFIFYEQLGFTGLGPGRLELREHGALSLKPFAVVLALYAVVTGIVLVAGIRRIWQNNSSRILLRLLGCLSVPSLLILLAGLMMHFRVLGRHFTPLICVVFLVLGAGLVQLWRQLGSGGKVVVVGFFVLIFSSSLMVRLSPRHEKDNYRQAARFAKELLAQNAVVWWNADRMGAEYYNVPLATNANALGQKALLIINPGDEIASLPKADLIISSRPDVFDSQGTVINYLKQENFQAKTNLPAFILWEQTLLDLP